MASQPLNMGLQILHDFNQLQLNVEIERAREEAVEQTGCEPTRAQFHGWHCVFR